MKKSLFLLIIIGMVSRAQASGQTQSALTLIEPSGARTASLGEAASALSDDVTAIAYNPSLLQTMKSGQVSLLYQRGLSNDGYGRLAIGMPGSKFSWGFSLGYYDSGSINVFDGSTARSVDGQKDLTAGFSLSKSFDAVSFGLTGKYISTTLAQTASANAMAVDLGMFTSVTNNIGLGLALQNYGSNLNYSGGSETLPRQVRAGLSFALNPFSLPSHVLTEAVYQDSTQKIEPALGLEMVTGPLAFRVGYRGGMDQDEFTVGTGFFWGTSSLDYSFGFADQLNSTQRISFSNRFGGPPATALIVKKFPEPAVAPAITFQAPRQVYEIKPAGGISPAARVYFVRQGDTLKSIAKAVYGREDMADEILRSNQHLLTKPDDLKPGQRILIPGKAD